MRPVIRPYGRTARQLAIMPCFLFTAATAFTSPSTWSPGVAVGPRVSGQAAAVDANGRVLAYGGLTNGAGSPTTNELWAYDKSVWTKIESSGGPGQRMYAASAVLGDKFFLFGGWDPEAPGTGGSFLDESWRLDLKTLEWAQLTALPGGPVSRHTACSVGDKIVIQTFRGTVLCDGEAVVEQPTTGEAPLGFSMSAAAPLGEHEMLLFGGSTKNQGMTADAYVLDTRTWAWRKLTAAGAAPTPRGSACAAAVGRPVCGPNPRPLGIDRTDACVRRARADDNTCVVFGGAGLGGGGYAGGAGLTPFDETWTIKVEGDNAVWTRLDLGERLPRLSSRHSTLSPKQRVTSRPHRRTTRATRRRVAQPAVLGRAAAPRRLDAHHQGDLRGVARPQVRHLSALACARPSGHRPEFTQHDSPRANTEVLLGNKYIGVDLSECVWLGGCVFCLRACTGSI